MERSCSSAAAPLGLHAGDIGHAVENGEDVSWCRNIANAPLHRRDLDIVGMAPDGAAASFCAVWIDGVPRSGAFEPVGTAPAHGPRGLGRAVMCEGLGRLRRMGATMAYVGLCSPRAQALYTSVDSRNVSCPSLGKRNCSRRRRDFVGQSRVQGVLERALALRSCPQSSEIGCRNS
jgi:ribosomal protein S18 acetylase RimI-like enzyme